MVKLYVNGSLYDTYTTFEKAYEIAKELREQGDIVQIDW